MFWVNQSGQKLENYKQCVIYQNRQRLISFFFFVKELSGWPINLKKKNSPLCGGLNLQARVRAFS
jgi:hypothetical protein